MEPEYFDPMIISDMNDLDTDNTSDEEDSLITIYFVKYEKKVIGVFHTHPPDCVQIGEIARKHVINPYILRVVKKVIPLGEDNNG